MKIAITGGTGFLGRYLIERLASDRHMLRCWYRSTSDRGGFDQHADAIEWIEGSLRNPDDSASLVAGCDAVVHAALDRPGEGFRGAEGNLVEFATDNIIGTLRLIESARAAKVKRFVFISSCAVHEKILDDRLLDETHPTWAGSHYGAHKAAIEQFVYSFGLGDGYPICALRPCGIYGLARPIERSKWFDLVTKVAHGETVTAERGGKEVYVGDVAAAAELLLSAPEETITGQAFNCCDQYVATHDVAQLAKEISGSSSAIEGRRTQPKHQIDTTKLRSLGMQFGGEERLRKTIRELVAAIDVPRS